MLSHRTILVDSSIRHKGAPLRSYGDDARTRPVKINGHSWGLNWPFSCPNSTFDLGANRTVPVAGGRTVRWDLPVPLTPAGRATSGRRGRSSMAELQSSKLTVRVRFPSAALRERPARYRPEARRRGSKRSVTKLSAETAAGRYRRRMPASLDELMHALHAADPTTDKDPLVDAIEALVADDPEGSRAVILAHDGYASTCLWALGLLGDPADVDLIAAALADPDPGLRYTALEALSNQPDLDRIDALARSMLNDPDSSVRSKAVGMVAYYARPGALDLLLPLAADPAANVRMVLGWRLGGLGDLAAEPTLRILLNDRNEQVRKFAARGLERMRRFASKA
jgi:hypothetical protein